jgi:uncharacterized membrane protein
MLGLLLVASLVLIVVAAADWSGPVPSVISFVVVFLAPGVGWQNLRGSLRFTPSGLGLAAAISVGVVVAVGLVMNGLSVTLTRPHWAVAMTCVLIAIALVTVLRPAAGAGRRLRPSPRGGQSGRPAAIAVAATCAVLATAGGLVAWYSQQHWLARQHYTELYATAAKGGREVVTVRNHEGEAVAYSARIAVAGQPATIAPFSLADGATWSRTVTVGPKSPVAGQPLLDVELSRLGVPGVYRFIRLFRPQLTKQPAS